MGQYLAISACCYASIVEAPPVGAKGMKSRDTNKSLVLMDLFCLDNKDVEDLTGMLNTEDTHALD